MTGDTAALTDLIVISGFSGAGKSTALAVFEDEGYFCVDNLPPEMILSFVDLFMHEGSKVPRAAVVSDARGGEHFEQLTTMLARLRERAVRYRIVFLEADEAALLTRYKETRRRHPLAPDGSVADGIARERELLAPVRARSDAVIDTTLLTAAMLRRRIAEELLPSQNPGRLAVTFQSFGFKYGPSRDADLLFDVRFLPNPHYEPQLRPFTGQDPRIVEYVNRGGALDALYAHLHPLLDYLLPQYLAEGKAHLVVAIACTGGRHRSVAIAEALAARYRDRAGYLVDIAHRDIAEAGMIDHVGFEVADLAASARFYDPVLHALGGRRMIVNPQAIAYGINGPTVWLVSRGLGPGSGYGHLALQANGKAAVDAAYAAGLAHGGRETRPASPPGQRPRYGRRYYAAYLLDPDGLRVEFVSRR